MPLWKGLFDSNVNNYVTTALVSTVEDYIKDYTVREYFGAQAIVLQNIIGSASAKDLIMWKLTSSKLPCDKRRHSEGRVHFLSQIWDY